MPRALRPWCLLLLALVSCRPPKASAPLADPSQAKPDARLVGLWSGRTSDGEAALLYVVPRKGALLDLVLLGADGDKGAAVLHYEGFPVALDKGSYLDVRAKRFAGEYGEDPSVSPEHLVLRYELDRAGQLTLSLMEAAPVREAIRGGALAGSVDGSEVRVTADTAAWAEFVRQAPAERLFRKLLVLKRHEASRPR